jgi:hypothetical protein
VTVLASLRSGVSALFHAVPQLPLRSQPCARNALRPAPLPAEDARAGRACADGVRARRPADARSARTPSSPNPSCTRKRMPADAPAASSTRRRRTVGIVPAQTAGTNCARCHRWESAPSPTMRAALCPRCRNSTFFPPQGAVIFQCTVLSSSAFLPSQLKLNRVAAKQCYSISEFRFNSPRERKST